MILATLKELYVRFGIIALSSIIILIIEAQYINELILLLLDPIKQLNDD